MLSPTRKKLDKKRQDLEKAIGVIEIISSLIWAKVADLNFAEGRKALGIFNILLSFDYMLIGTLHLRSKK